MPLAAPLPRRAGRHQRRPVALTRRCTWPRAGPTAWFRLYRTLDLDALG